MRGTKPWVAMADQATRKVAREAVGAVLSTLSRSGSSRTTDHEACLASGRARGRVWLMNPLIVRTHRVDRTVCPLYGTSVYTARSAPAASSDMMASSKAAPASEIGISERRRSSRRVIKAW